MQKIRHDFAERVRFLLDALDARAIALGQRAEVDQPRVAVNRRQAVAELVRDAGGHLADLREALAQPQLLFELHTVLRSVNRQIRP